MTEFSNPAVVHCHPRVCRGIRKRDGPTRSRSAGFPHVSGYDVQDYVKLRLPADRERFRFDPTSGDGTEYPAMTKVPWPDNTFDFVFATQVFEHVSDQELAYSEVHRVLKPGGSFLNIFPSKSRPIEAHINIPFGGVLTSRPYHQLCAALGIRGLNQEALHPISPLI